MHAHKKKKLRDAEEVKIRCGAQQSSQRRSLLQQAAFHIICHFCLYLFVFSLKQAAKLFS